jgi:glycerol transport system substrate-binding protein
MFWYTAFTADMVEPGLPVMNEDGTPRGAWRLRRMASTGRRPEGRLSGRWFLDADEVDPGRSCQAAWLYAQFVTSKTVDLKKSMSV